jgi:hypothetical protein
MMFVDCPLGWTRTAPSDAGFPPRSDAGTREAGQRRLRVVAGMAGWYCRCPRCRSAPAGFRCPGPATARPAARG